MARIVGIDLGTTNSCVAYMDHGTPRVISARHERAMVPSVVALTDNGLADAVHTLAQRAPVPVTVNVDESLGRLPGPVETAAYFVVAESLANIAKYAISS